MSPNICGLDAVTSFLIRPRHRSSCSHIQLPASACSSLVSFSALRHTPPKKCPDEGVSSGQLNGGSIHLLADTSVQREHSRTSRKSHYKKQRRKAAFQRFIWNCETSAASTNFVPFLLTPLVVVEFLFRAIPKGISCTFFLGTLNFRHRFEDVRSRSKRQGMRTTS